MGIKSINSIAFHPKTLVLLRLFFGAMLIYAAIDKILFPIDFAVAVENYQLTGATISRWIAIWLPYLELITGVLLIANIWMNAATLLNICMMAVFLLSVSSAYARNLDINCGCFGDVSSPVTLTKVASNTLLLLFSVLLYISCKNRNK